ncbi:MAG: fibronectin type III domain-containing protein [Gammaproteobacteria bacterium]|nr:fibronectin type III domain-containing protein [Gammaproteobacteria bacterium]
MRASARCAGALLALAGALAHAQTDILTSRYDAARTGQNLSESILTALNVNVGSFGRLYAYPLDGQAYAQPLVKAQLPIAGLGTYNVVFVATEHGSVYALDADSATPIWLRSFIDPAHGLTTRTTNPSLEDIVPEVSITSTPVIDPVAGTLYVVGETVQGSGTPYYWLHALDITTGADKVAPVKVQASVGGGAPPLSVVAAKSQQRPGLVLANGTVYVGLGSSGDNFPWVGWLLGYDATTLAQVAVFCASPGGTQGAGLWSSGAAPAVDAAGNVYVVTGNGYFSGSGGFGDAIVKLAAAGTVLDYFAPFNAVALAAADLDLAAGGVTVLPDPAGSLAHPHLLIGAGKDGEVYLLDRDSLGGYNANYATPNSYIVQWLPGQVGTAAITPTNPVLPYAANSYTTPAYWQNSVYFCGVQDTCKQFALSNAQLSTTAVSNTVTVYGYPGAQPVISAASAAATSAILWTLERDTTHNLTVLHAYDATNLATELYNSSQAAGGRDAGGVPVRYAVPAVANGMVFVDTAVELDVYGLLAGAPASLAAPTFSPAPGPYITTQTVTLSATPGATIYYTLDGSLPTLESGSVYSAPLTLSTTGTVRAMAVQAGSLSSAPASATYTIGPPPVPTAPATLTATAAGPTAIGISWVAATEGGGTIAQYLIERCQGSGCAGFAPLATVNAPTTSFMDGGLSAATTYSYRVRAQDGLGTTGPYSNTATTSTSAATPGAPGTLTGGPAGATSVNLSWGAASEPGGTLTKYLIERCQGAGCANFVQVVTVNVPITSLADGGLTGSTAYRYRVRAQDRNGALGPYSNVLTISTAAAVPGVPGTLTASATGAATTHLSWGAASEPGGTLSAYLIERCAGAGCASFTQVASVPAAATTFDDSGLSGSTSYSYRVRAQDTLGATGSYSNTASATTAASPPAPGGGGGALGPELLLLAALAGRRLRRGR